ncbi:hypothetical protein [Actinoplanes solisilvae]|uniref:hypothetical protein n=1 Tax=Actinoplanes solisilvae TaxID=2486853 RepID=UPI000FDA940D|nr:hypothetical protein [Actinoplanes solisilvae]
MRKLRYAGAAIAGGIVLFGAAPAQADVLPGADVAAQQADARLADLLGQSNGLNVDNPLQYSTLSDTPLGRSPVAQFSAGQNSPDLNPLLPGESATDHRPQPPAASVVRRPRTLLPGVPGSSGLPGLSGLSGQGLPVQGLPVQGLPVRDLPLLGDRSLPLLGDLLPSGQTRSFGQRPTMRQAEMFDGGLPLLGGLGGLLPANESPRTPPAGDGPDLSGLPAGGMAILPAALNGSAAAPAAGSEPAASEPAASEPAAPAPVAEQPAQDKPAKPTKAKPAKSHPVETPEDPRLHEEPVDDDTVEDRPFSSEGRPVAGVDEQYR